LNKFADTLRQNRRFLISTHVQPDGDGIGSEIALYHHLKKTGKEAWVINPSPTPEKFEVIDPSRIIQVFSSGLKVPDVDTVIIVDTNEVKMLGALAPVVENLKVPILFVDHHVKELQDTSGHLIDEKSGSSGEIVYRFIKSQGTELTFEMAQALYVAILTDTGNFRFQRTSPSTHETVADLLRTGVKPEQVFQSVFGKDSAEKLRLLGKTLQTLKLECQGQFFLRLLLQKPIDKQLGSIGMRRAFHQSDRAYARRPDFKLFHLDKIIKLHAPLAIFEECRFGNAKGNGITA
jgi:phosphoesterase RecJ-like protein